MLGSIGCYIHAIKFFNETAFPEEGTYNSQAAGGNNAFICKFNNNVLIGVQWVNNDIEQQSITKA